MEHWAKRKIAIELVKHVVSADIEHGHVVADRNYGRSRSFRENLRSLRRKERGCNTATDSESSLLLEIDLFSLRGTDSTVASLSRIEVKHDLNERGFLVNADDYLTAPFATK
ncbi:hypothetical protein EA473_14385 [Natrarchaeobius chitinivorans]|uniref:Transposase n=1 Tax=Natrarchaeobius chitinivorans TaxID=1679083 RepID=A0A3N6PAY1_NATCH|nr:hypothetical protein EA473_14385 [Natrarchaeobius chitinivorans]